MQFKRKQQFAAICFGICFLSVPNLEAAPTSSLRSEPRRQHAQPKRDETSETLRKLSHQIKQLQDQISSIKLAQSSLGSDSIVKNMAPKVRRMEMQIDYIEKKMRDLPSYNEYKALVAECENLKSQVDSLGNGGSGGEEAIEALTPVMTKMQKQIMFLYQKYRTQESDSYALLDEKYLKLSKDVDAVHRELKERNEQIVSKIVQMQQGFSSLTELNKHFAAQHLVVSELQAQVQVLAQEIREQKTSEVSLKEKNEKDYALLMKGLTFLNKKLSALESDDRLRQIAERANAVESAFQEMQVKQEMCVKAEVERASTPLQLELKELKEKEEKHKKALGFLYTKVKGQQESFEKLASELKAQLTAFSDKMNTLESQEALSELNALKQQIQSMSAAYQSAKEKIEAHENTLTQDLPSFAQKFDMLQKQVSTLYKYHQTITQQKESHELSTTLQEMEKKSSQISKLEEEIHNLKKASEALSTYFNQGLKSLEGKIQAQSKSPQSPHSYDEAIALLKKQIGALYKGYKALKEESPLANAQELMQKLEGKLAKIEDMEKEIQLLKAFSNDSKYKELEEKIVQLQRQNSFLYSKLTEESSKEISSEKLQLLIQKYEELKAKLEGISPQSSSELSLQQELKKRDEEIAKLKRRVLYLYSKSRGAVDKEDPALAIAEKFSALKQELEAKIAEQHQRAAEDKVMINNLVEKVSELEETLQDKVEDKE